MMMKRKMIHNVVLTGCGRRRWQAAGEAGAGASRDAVADAPAAG